MKRLAALNVLTLAALGCLTFTLPVRADVRLPALFSEGMVLQQGMPLPVWGWADEGEKVSVTFRGTTKTTTAKDGKWSVKFPAQKACDGDTLEIRGQNAIRLNNVAVGEVWVCSGQSNMEWPLSRAYGGEAAMAASANPKLRLFLVPKLKANAPVTNVVAEWKEASPETTRNFSAVAYFFGRDLQKSRNVPVGLIETCWGGSPAEVWMSQEVLQNSPGYKQAILDGYEAAVKKAEAAAQPRQRPAWKPCELYNGMIAPLLPYAIKGAIWYQGESNAGRAEQYRSLMADLIRNWRTDWKQGDFTFLQVQLAPYDKNRKRALEDITAAPVESDWPELREAQMLVTKNLPKAGIAVITDVGEKDDIHPKHKEEVGGRLALAARGIAYGERIEYSGPIYKGMKVKGDKAILTFDHAKSGLEARGGDLQGFAICGPDRKFVWAKAEIQGSKVVVSSPQVQEPLAVRYGWADYPVVNLCNKSGLPASPFRTDDFPMLTAGKR